MKKFYELLIFALNSWVSVLFVLTFCAVSFYFGQNTNDMNIFAASGAVMTVFGLFSMIKFTTIEKYLNQEAIIAASTGLTSKPLKAGESERLQKEYQAAARIRLNQELKSELKGISLTILGTLIWAYGAYIPVLTILEKS